MDKLLLILIGLSCKQILCYFIQFRFSAFHTKVVKGEICDKLQKDTVRNKTNMAKRNRVLSKHFEFDMISRTRGIARNRWHGALECTQLNSATRMSMLIAGTRLLVIALVCSYDDD